MVELSIIERYIYQTLKGYIVTTHGLRLEIMPFDLNRQQNEGSFAAVPVVYFRYVSGDDRNAVGPGKRLMTSAVYEIGVFHDANTFGAEFLTPNGQTLSLLSILNYIDNQFQDFVTPTNQTGGVIFSVQRQSPVRMTERGPDGVLYKRDGGLFEFHVRKEGP